MGKKKVIDEELDRLVKEKRHLERRLIINNNKFRKLSEKLSDVHTTIYWNGQALEEVRLKMRDIILSRMSPEEAQVVRGRIEVAEEIDRQRQREDLKEKMEAAVSANARAYKYIEETVLGQKEPATCH